MDLEPLFQGPLLISKEEIRKIKDKREYLKDVIAPEDMGEFNPEIIESGDE